MSFFVCSCVMPSMHLLTFVLPLAAAVAIARADAPLDLTLDQALAAVEHANVNAVLSREAVAQAMEAANQQRVNLLPHVALAAQQERALTVSNQTGVLVPSGPGNRFDGQFTANYDLLNPSQIENYRSARTAAQGAQLNYQAALQSVLAVVAQAYFTHLHNLHRIDVLDSNIARAKSLLDLAQVQLRAGVATQIDVTRAEAELATDEQARLQQDTTVYQSELQLKRLLDLDLGPPLKLADFPVQQVDTTEFDAGTEQHAFERRPDYLGGKSLVKQNQQEVLAAKFENLPTLSLVGDYGQAQMRAFDGTAKEEWLAGVQLNLPIFDGLKARADRRAALSHLRAQERSLQVLHRPGFVGGPARDPGCALAFRPNCLRPKKLAAGRRAAAPGQPALQAGRGRQPGGHRCAKRPGGRRGRPQRRHL